MKAAPCGVQEDRLERNVKRLSLQCCNFMLPEQQQKFPAVMNQNKAQTPLTFSPPSI